MEVLAVQYDTDKKDKLEKWETWKVKLRSILALKRGHLDELKAEDPSNNNVEELLSKAKVSIYNHTLNVTCKTDVLRVGYRLEFVNCLITF